MSPIKSRLFRLSRLFALCSGMLVLFMVATPAKAQCIAQQEVGSWVNADPNTRSLTRADLRFTCQDQVLNGEPYPPGPPWHMHLWGKCSPTDCDWSEIGADSVTIGSRTYVQQNGVWIDTAYDPSTMTTTKITFLSDDYFAFLKAHPELAGALALGDKVIVAVGTQFYEIAP